MAGSRHATPLPIDPEPLSGSNMAVLKTLTASKAGEVEQKIHDELYAYCVELAKNLDEKQGIGVKYFKVKSSQPAAINEQADSEARKAFLENFSEFYKELREALDQLTKEDVKTISAEEKSQSDALKKFKKWFVKLNKAGFYDANGRPVNFWSGDEAQAEANQTLFSLSDADVPSISIVSKLGNLLKDHSSRSLSDIAFFAGSALFADQASGNVFVYSSASNINEEEQNIFTVNNFHWNIELPIVRAKQNAGLVKNIYYVGYSHSKGDWKKGGLALVSLNNDEELREDIKKNAEENYTPILVQKNNLFWMYGDPDGSGFWKLTSLDSLTEDSISLLKTLPFDGCDLLLHCLDENDDIRNMDVNILIEARSTSAPLLIKKSDNTFLIYGYQEGTGCWELTPVTSEKMDLNQLPFDKEKTVTIPRNHALFTQDIVTTLSPGHHHFRGMIRGEDVRLTTDLVDTLKSGHANWQKLFNANNLGQTNSLSLTLRRNSLESFFDLSLMVSTIRLRNTIYIENNADGIGLDYEVIASDNELVLGTIPWKDLPRELKKSPDTLREIKDLTRTFLSPIVNYIASHHGDQIKPPTREQKKEEREKWIKTAPARPSIYTNYLFEIVSPRLERSRNRSDSLSSTPKHRDPSDSHSSSPSPSPSPRNRIRTDSLSPRRRPNASQQTPPHTPIGSGDKTNTVEYIPVSRARKKSGA